MRNEYPRVLLDMDGVLCDFDRAMREAHGGYVWTGGGQQPWHTPSWLGMTDEEWWAPANNAGFWANLPWTDDGRDLLAIIRRHIPIENICLLTSPSLDPESMVGKLRWIERELPAFKRRFLMGSAKEFAASSRTILVDDYDGNIIKFARAGGATVRVPRPWNMDWRASDLVLSYVAADFQRIMEGYEQRAA